ncbi:MAG TPA: hypothetical protein VF354_01175 [Candidatus Methanoperedens sp.]
MDAGLAYFIFYHISKKKGVSAIGSITGMSVSMIAGTVLIGFAVVKLFDKNIHV